MTFRVLVNFGTCACFGNICKCNFADCKIMLHKVIHKITVIIIYSTFEIVNYFSFVNGKLHRFVIIYIGKAVML